MIKVDDKRHIIKIKETTEEEETYRVHFRAVCTCGWEGPWRDFFSDSSLDRREHEEVIS